MSMRTTTPFPARHVAALILLVLGVAWMLLDAAGRRAGHREHHSQVRAVVRLLGTADMVLSSSSRWLRRPSLSEPGAAFADGPAILDNDPAGAVMRPPREVFAAGAGALPAFQPLQEGK
jgi:hypothetical protein